MGIKDLFNSDLAEVVRGGGGGGGGSSPSIRITASGLLTLSAAAAEELDIVSEMEADFLYDTDHQVGVLRPLEGGDLTFRSRGEGDAVYVSFRGVGSKIGLDVEHAVKLPYETDEGDIYIDFTPAFEAMESGEYDHAAEAEEAEEEDIPEEDIEADEAEEIIDEDEDEEDEPETAMSF